MKLFKSFPGAQPFLIFFVLVGGLATVRVSRADFEDIKESIDSYFQSYRDMADSLENVTSELDGYSPIGRSDRQVARDYYNGLRRAYLVEGIRSQKDSMISKVKEYADSTASAISSYIRFVEDSPGISNSGWNRRNNWNNCLNDSSVTAINRSYVANASQRLEDIFNDVEKELRKEFVIRRGSVESGSATLSGTQNEMLRSIVTNLDRDWKTVLTGCCEQAGLKRDSCSTKADEIFKGVAGQPALVNSGVLAPAPYFPDAFSNSALKPAELVAIIRDDRSLERDLRGARSRRDADAELEALSAVEIACARAKEHQQERAGPDRMMKSLGTSIGKTIKCHVLPFLGTQYLDTEYQRMSTAFANSPIQGNQWDVNCDPRETAIYDMLRPLDPMQIASRWGINDNMSNPPWIAMLRRLQPVQSPFPMVSLPGAGVVTPYGILGRGPGESGNSAGGGSSGNSSGGSRGTLIPKQRTSSSAAQTGSRLATRRASSRGLAQGSNSVFGIRKASASIARGRAIAENVSALRSGTKKTRALASSMESNNRKLSSNERRGQNSKSAGEARTLVRGLSGARASRTSAQRIARGVGGTRSSGRRQAQANYAGKTLAEVEAENEKERLRLEALAKMYVSNIDLAKKQAEAIRQQIFEKIMTRDAKITNLVGEILNKPPKKQAAKVMNTRRELMQIDRELGQLKAQYDVYVGSVLEQASLLRNAVALGVGDSLGPSMMWDPRMAGGVGATASPSTINGPQPPDLAVPPALMPQNIPISAPGFPQVQAAPAAQGQLEEKFFKIFNQWSLVPKAFAAPQKKLGIFKNEREWRKGFEQFKSDLFDYSDAKLKTEQALLKQASEVYGKRVRSVNLESARDFDTEVLIGMEIFAGNMTSEVSDLLSKATRGEIVLSPGQKNALQITQRDSSATLELLEKISLQYKDAYPLSDEDNPEIWWGMLPEMLVY